MSLRRFNGWEPEEVHIHYDLDGKETGRTITTREPEWDDTQRAFALGLLDYEAQVCSNCGGHFSHTMDATVTRRVQFQKVECLDCKAIKVIRDLKHKGHGDDCSCSKHVAWVDRYDPLPHA